MTWIDRPQGYVLCFNRDELRTRMRAAPPALARRGGTRYLAPQDGDFGGTWLAVNEHGLALALLNGHRSGDAPAERPDGFTSRGLLVTALIDREDAVAVERALVTRDLGPFRSFLLVAFGAAGDRRLATWRDGALSVVRELDGHEPLISSSFDTSDVARSRRERFQAWQASAPADPLAMRLEFHASHVPEKGPRSVCMHRPDAETVSFSVVEVDASHVRYRYAAGSPCTTPLDPRPLVLSRR